MTDTVEGANPQPSGRSGLAAMLLPELKKLGASLGVKGTGSMRKGALIDAIKSAQRGGSNTGENSAPRKRAAEQPTEQPTQQPALVARDAAPSAAGEVDDVAARLEALKAGDKNPQRNRRNDGGESGGSNQRGNDQQRSNDQRGNDQAKIGRAHV